MSVTCLMMVAATNLACCCVDDAITSSSATTALRQTRQLNQRQSTLYHQQVAVFMHKCWYVHFNKRRRTSEKEGCDRASVDKKTTNRMASRSRTDRLRSDPDEGPGGANTLTSGPGEMVGLGWVGLTRSVRG